MTKASDMSLYPDMIHVADENLLDLQIRQK